MKFKIGIDVGGTFTDFLVVPDGTKPRVFKVLSTPGDPSVGLLEGLEEIAGSYNMSLAELSGSITTIVHGTTVSTNAVLTNSGAHTGLITTAGVRDALEMRRGIREEQYNNRYTNVRPLVPRYLRRPVKGRLNYAGEVLEPLDLEDVKDAIRIFKQEGVEAVAICFMNSFANPEHERKAAKLVEEEMPGTYLTVSSSLLPVIRFYNRVSTTVLNSYVGPKLCSYIDSLKSKLQKAGFQGVLLIMQSNGGVMSPEVATPSAALTLLSGPAAGPQAGLSYVARHGHDSCITVDMGGTSFDAALVRNGTPLVVTEGEINRYRSALPMLDIVTIGAGGGSIAWIDEGGLLRSGPQSAGADPGPVCYGRGGKKPTCTDANLVLGYLCPDFFAGGRIKLDKKAAAESIETQIAGPLKLSVEAAAAGMYQVINTNMAQGVREVSIKRGLDPREFPMVVAGGAGPLHACMICRELDIPMFVVPRESSIFCAAGMLMSDFVNDFTRSFVSEFGRIDWAKLNSHLNEMMQEGRDLLKREGIAEDRQEFTVHLDCRYIKQYHEVSFPAELSALRAADLAVISRSFHAEHQRLYGYSLEAECTEIELINISLRAVGITQKPLFEEEPRAEAGIEAALKGQRAAYVPETRSVRDIPVYDGDKLQHGNCVSGPCLIEQVNTTLLLTASFDCLCDNFGSFVVFEKGKTNVLAPRLQELMSVCARKS